MTTIPASEVAEVFRKALLGEIAVKVIGRSWADIWCGDVEFAFGDWRITIFNDVMELDYVDSVIAPDGRTAEFDDWQPEDPERLVFDPVDSLETAERTALESLLESLEPEQTS